MVLLFRENVMEFGLRSSCRDEMSSASPNNNPIKNVFNGVHNQATRWLRHISEAADAYKHRDFGKNRRVDLTASSLPQSPPDTEAADDSIDKTKDADESNDGAKEGNDLDISGTSQEGGESNQSNDSSQTQSTTPTPHASPSSAGLSDATDHGRKSVDSSPSQRRKAEPLRLMTVENSLIQPSEVVVSQKSVLTAEPVLTPLEQLRLKDEAIRRALAEKQQLVADILHVPREEFDTIAELAGEPSIDKEATELVLAAVSQANQLAAALNDALRITEEAAVTVTSEVLPGYSPRGGRRKQRLPGVPAQKLQGISNNLNSQLTQLLKIIKERDEERERLRKELQRSREQIHVLHETHRKSSSSPSHSRDTDGAAQESGDALPEQSAATKDTDTDETVTNNEQQNTDAQEVKPDVSQEVFVDALSGDSETSQARSETTEPKLETEESLPVGVE